MNKIIFFLSMVLAIAILIGCLKTTPKDGFIADTFYKTDNDYKGANTAVYSVLENSNMYGRMFSNDFDWGNDEMVTYRQPNTQSLQNYNYTPGESLLFGTWTQLYNGIARANSFLDNTQNLKDTLIYYEAEVRFLRGYFYFLLAQHWGSVPIRDHAYTSISYTSNIHFQPVDSVYLFAINDMETAYPKLLSVTDARALAGRVNKSVCAGILARAYLHMAGCCFDADKPAPYKQVKGKIFEAQLKNTSAKIFLEKAVDWADTVIKHNYFDIASISYDSIFIAEAQNADFNKREAIWEAMFYGNKAGQYADYNTAGTIGILNGVYGLQGSGYGFITLYAVKHYDTMIPDKRYKRNIAKVSYTTTDFIVLKETKISGITAVALALGKWRRLDEKLIPYGSSSSPTNFPILRYADVLLMHAEAVNELALLYATTTTSTNSPLVGLEAIRKRAGLPYANTLPAIGTFALRDTIRIERMRELVGEGLRRQDLIRWGDYFEKIEENIKIYDVAPYNSVVGSMNYGHGLQVFRNIVSTNQYKHLVKPIPQQELNLNKSSTARQHPLWQ